MKAPALYPIVNVAGAGAVEAQRATALALALADAGLAWIQLRAKTLGAGDYARLAAALSRELERRGARLIVNDRADVAAAAGAAGLHVGDEDLPVAAARALLGPRCLIGYSTHAVAEVTAACSATGAAGEGTADYLGFGPVFDSPTKAGVRQARGLALLERACNGSDLPVVAIGGVTIETAALCWQAGAASVAVISELERAQTEGRLADLLRRYRRAAGL